MTEDLLAGRLVAPWGFSDTPGQLALAWLLKVPGGTIPLVGTANPAHIEEAVAAIDITLARDDWYEMMVIARGRPMPWGQSGRLVQV